MPFFEPTDKIEPRPLNFERARKSLREELEAINYYQKRIDATRDEYLKRILDYNMNEEKGHVAMPMEWVRRNDPLQDRVFKEHE